MKPFLPAIAVMKRLVRTLAFVSWLIVPVISGAAPMGFTDSADFLTSLPGPTGGLDFDSVVAGTPIPSGGTVGGITFDYDFGGVQLLVSDVFDTSSAPNFLGTDDGDILQDGDDFAISLASTNAVGISFITADTLFDDDIVLSVGGFSVGIDAAAVQQVLSDGSSVYFLGIIDTMTGFTGAEISTIGGGFFLYNVDDIVTSTIPEPSSALLFGAGTLICGGAIRRRRY